MTNRKRPCQILSTAARGFTQSLGSTAASAAPKARIPPATRATVRNPPRSRLPRRRESTAPSGMATSQLTTPPAAAPSQQELQKDQYSGAAVDEHYAPFNHRDRSAPPRARAKGSSRSRCMHSSPLRFVRRPAFHLLVESGTVSRTRGRVSFGFVVSVGVIVVSRIRVPGSSSERFLAHPAAEAVRRPTTRSSPFIIPSSVGQSDPPSLSCLLRAEHVPTLDSTTPLTD